MYELLLLINFLLWAGILFLFVRQPTASVFHPMAFYLAFHFLVFVARPPLVYFRGYDRIYDAYQFIPTIEDKSIALAVTMVGLVAFAATNLATARSPINFARTPQDQSERRRLLALFPLVVMLLAPIALYSLYLSWYSDVSGIDQMVIDAATQIVTNTSSNGYVFESRQFLGPLALIFAWLTRFRWYSFLPIALFILVAGGTGTRGPFVLGAVAVGIAWLYEQKRKWPHWKVVAAAFAVIFIFVQVGADRGESIRALFVSEQVDAGHEEQNLRFLESMDIANLEFVEYLVWTVPQRTGTYNYFLPNLQVFTEWVPRTLWPEKPVGPPIPMYNLFDYGTPYGMTNSLPGEGWAALGFAGVVIWCALWGWIWGRAYEWFARGHASNLKILGYLSFLPLSILFFRDGSLVSMLRFGIFLGMPVLVMYLLTRLAGWRTQETALAPAFYEQDAAARGHLVPRAHRGDGAVGLAPRAWRDRQR